MSYKTTRSPGKGRLSRPTTEKRRGEETVTLSLTILALDTLICHVGKKGDKQVYSSKL